MSRKSGYATVLQERMLKREDEVRHHTRVFMMDMVTAALGRMGWGEKRFEKFDKVLSQVFSEYTSAILSDAKDDPDLVYAKACLDRELKQYVGSKFIPYDQRYAR